MPKAASFILRGALRIGALSLLFALMACGSRGPDAPPPAEPSASNEEEGDSQERPKVAAPAPTPAPAAVAPRVSRDLVAEAGRAELRQGGLFIDIGSLDQHKYSRGGFMTGWSRNALDEQLSIATIEERSATLDVVLEAPVSEILVRAKGRGTLGIALDEGGKQSARLGKSYAEHRFAFAKPLAAGRHRLRLSGRGTQIDWLYLARATGSAAPDAARTEGGALLAPEPRSYSYYLIPEPGARLQLRTEGQGAIEVIAQVDGKAAQSLVQSGAGQSHDLDLAAYVGVPTRLSLRAKQGPLRWTSARITRPAAKPATLSAKPKNVILLLIDTQRADSFSVVGKDIGAKTYEALIKTSSTFTNAYNNENWTKPSIATIDTGLYPSTHLARWRKDRCSSDLVFLSEHLQAQGFATGAMVSNISAGPKFGFDQGWDSFKKTDDAEQAFASAAAWLDGRKKDKPFFLYVQTIDPHVPFSVPQGSAEAIFGGPYTGKLGPSFEQSEEDALNAGTLKLSAEDERWLQALYDAEVLYHDKHLGIFLAGLRDKKILDDTLFVILNDHGEEFGEHGRWGHGWTIGDALYRSPLLMHMPGFLPARTFGEVVEHVDVAPTIVDALGLPAMESAEGESLLPLLHDQERAGRAPYSALLFGRPKQRAIRVGDFKMLVKANRSEELFNMVAEPEQKTDVKEAHPIALRLCELALGEAIANPKRSERLSDRSSLLPIKAQFIDE